MDTTDKSIIVLLIGRTDGYNRQQQKKLEGLILKTVESITKDEDNRQIGKADRSTDTTDKHIDSINKHTDNRQTYGHNRHVDNRQTYRHNKYRHNRQTYRYNRQT